MNIRMDQACLEHALESVVGVSEGTALSSLSSELIESQDGALTLTATDNETSSRMVEPAEVIDAGRVLLPTKKLYDIVKSLPAGLLELVVDRAWGTITAGSARFQLLGLDPSQFPDCPEPDMSADISIDAALLRGIIRRTLYAVGQNDTRFVLHGLYLDVEDGKLTAVGTDGHRLVVEEWPGVVPEGMSWSGIVPKKAVQQLARRLDGVETVNLGVTYGRLFHAWVGGYRLTSRMIEGKYPNWQRLVPQKDPVNALTIAREELMAGVKRVALVSGNGLITVEYTDGGAVLSC